MKKEFEEQEAWLEESQYMFLRLETDIKLYLESTEVLPKEPRVEDSYRNDIEKSYEDTVSRELIKVESQEVIMLLVLA